MLGASNLRQQKRLWTLLGRPDMVKKTNDERDADQTARCDRAGRDHADAHRGRMGGVPAGAPRAGVPRAHHGRGGGRPADRDRGIIHRHAGATGVEGGFGVPLAAFTFAHGGPRIDTPPPALGEHNDEIFAELGYGKVAAE